MRITFDIHTAWYGRRSFNYIRVRSPPSLRVRPCQRPLTMMYKATVPRTSKALYEDWLAGETPLWTRISDLWECTGHDCTTLYTVNQTSRTTHVCGRNIHTPGRTNAVNFPARTARICASVAAWTQNSPANSRRQWSVVWALVAPRAVSRSVGVTLRGYIFFDWRYIAEPYKCHDKPFVVGL